MKKKRNEDEATAKSISNCNVTDGIFMSLFEDITTLNNIVVVVDIRNNQITEDGFKQFFEKFSKKCEEGNDDVSFRLPRNCCSTGIQGAHRRGVNDWSRCARSTIYTQSIEIEKAKPCEV